MTTTASEYHMNGYNTNNTHVSENTWTKIQYIDRVKFFDSLFSRLLCWIYSSDKKVIIRKRMIYTFISKYKYKKTLSSIAQELGHATSAISSTTRYFEDILNSMIRKSSEANYSYHKISSDSFLESLAIFYTNLDDAIIDCAHTDFQNNVMPVLLELKTMETKGIIPRLPKGWWDDAKMSFVTYKKFMGIKTSCFSTENGN
jgi:hypothetical protein